MAINRCKRWFIIFWIIGTERGKIKSAAIRVILREIPKRANRPRECGYIINAMSREVCALCGKELPDSGFYVVRIDVFADPAVPPMTSEELAAFDFDFSFKHLIEEMENLSAEELQDQVHRLFEHRICAACQPKFLANPLGKPRTVREGEN